MNKKILDNQVQFTLELYSKKKDTEFLKKAFFFELSSFVFYIVPYLIFALLGFHIGALIGSFVFISFFILIINGRNISKLPELFSQLNFFAYPFINNYLKKELNLSLYDYRKVIKNKKYNCFYESINDISTNEYKSALYFWSQINCKIDDLEIKKIATNKILLINYKIEYYNKEVDTYNNKQIEINKILEKEGLVIKKSKQQKIKIMSI
jgi:hypothetical protein